MSCSGPISSTNLKTSSVMTAIAIDRDKNSEVAVKWAVENLLKSGFKCFFVHVRIQSLHPHDCVTTPKEGRPTTDAELKQLFLPYRGYCARKGIVSKEVVLHDFNVPSALIDFTEKNNINNIVVGASSRNVITRKLRNPDVPSSLIKLAPESCTVYVISKGKVQISRVGVLGDVSQTPKHIKIPHKSPHLKSLLSKLTIDNDSTKSEGMRRASPFSFNNELSPLTHTYPENTVSSFEGSRASNYRTNSEISSDSFVSTLGDMLLIYDEEIKSSAHSIGSQSPKSPHMISMSESSNMLTNDEVSSTGSQSTERNNFSGPPSWQSTDISGPNSDVTADDDSDSLVCLSPQSLEINMRRIRKELKKSMEMFKSVTMETTLPIEKVRMLQEWKAEEEHKLEKINLDDETTMSLAEAESQRTKVAIEMAKMGQRLADLETQMRKLAELKAKEAKKRGLDQLVNNKAFYRKYNIDDIGAATDHFAISNKIGEGGYGPVFKATLDHTAVAIKILRSDISQGLKQFQQEVNVLSCMRHPNMVLLLGACPEYGCLVYEYMDNGSLEDRLFQKNNTPSLPWKTRFKIAAEIATGLLFLHQTKPEPLVHRDLKPANILLDSNFVSKISDVGLSRLVPASVADNLTQYHITSARGTFYYIDPEYQQSGILGVKSDLYSFGVVLLQLITAKPPVGLIVDVRRAIEKGTFAEVLDPTVPDWPVEEALSLAKLGLQCCELSKKDRPDLASAVFPELNRLRNLALGHEDNEIEKVACEQPLHNSAPQVESQ